jgi:hypothetical protein
MNDERKVKFTTAIILLLTAEACFVVVSYELLRLPRYQSTFHFHVNIHVRHLVALLYFNWCATLALH